MKVITIESQTNLKKLKQKNNFIPEMVDRLFLICKDDKNFTIRTDVESIDIQLNMLKERIIKQDSLLTQAQNMKDELSSKLNSIDEKSFRIKVDVLESLGSEL